MAKSRGDKGQPCLVPLPKAKANDCLSDTLIAACGEAYRRRSHDMKQSPNPNLDSITHRYGQLILSKTLFASREKEHSLSCIICLSLHVQEQPPEVGGCGLLRHKPCLVKVYNGQDKFVHSQCQDCGQNV